MQHPSSGDSQMTIHLVPVEHPDHSDKPQVDSVGLSGLTDVYNSRMVTDLVLVNGRYVAIVYLDDGDGPLLDED